MARFNYILIFFILLASINLLYAKTYVEVTRPLSGIAEVFPGHSVRFVWRYQMSENFHKFFCGYFNSRKEFVVLAADFNGKEFSLSHQVKDTPEDEKRLLGRIKDSFAVNYAMNEAERGITLTNFQPNDEGRFECGFQKTPISGILFGGKIDLKTRHRQGVPYVRRSTGRQSVKDASKKTDKKSGSIPIWAIVLSIATPIVMGMLIMCACIYRRSKKLRQSLGSDRESLMGDVVSSDEDEILQYQKKVDLAATKSK